MRCRATGSDADGARNVAARLVQVTVRKGIHLKWPRAETPTHYIAMGLPELDEAAKLAVREMIDSRTERR